MIGELKDYPQMEMDKYYLSTGVDQPTAKAKLKNYRIVIDAAPAVISKIAKHYHAKLHVPSFVQEHHRDRLSVVPDILMLVAFLLLGMLTNMMLAMGIKRQARLTRLHGDLLRNWVINRSARLFLTEAAFAFAAYIFLRWHAFYSTYGSLVITMTVSWLIMILTFCGMIWYLVRKDKKVVKSTK